jgi:DMSO/TMAO reductase YedYZ molybdopterin-dependent catalytic subunit
VEVREYQGERLSSNTVFLENSIHGPQYIDESIYTLIFTELVNSPWNYLYTELPSLFPQYQKGGHSALCVSLGCHILWDGIHLSDILDAVMVNPQANTGIFQVKDGYSSSLPLAYIRDRDILLAYKMNNLNLPAERSTRRWGDSGIYKILLIVIKKLLIYSI